MSDEARAKTNTQSALTVERAAWIMVGLLAAGLRLFQLGLRPLGEGEAVQALAAYRFTQGAEQMAPAGAIPAMFAANAIGFSLMGASDMVVRLLPALAGLILVLLPFGLRHRLGRGGALAAALLLAFSPSAVYFSRTLDSAIVVAACGLALVVGLINYLDSRRPAFLYAAAVALGVGLCAGPGTFSLLLIFALFGLALYLGARLLDRTSGWSSLVVAWSALRGERGLLARTAVVLAAAFGLTATALVLHPAGIGHAADLMGAWARGFLPEPGGQPFIYPLLLLLRYEPLILLLGLVEAGWVLLRSRTDPRWAALPRSAFPHTAFLAFWVAAAGIIVLLAGHRPAGNIMLMVVPLALLAGQGFERAWRWVSTREVWPSAVLFAAIALSLLAFFYLQLGFYSHASPTDSLRIADLTLYTTSTHLILVSVSLLLLIALCAVVWIWRGPEMVIAGGWVTILVALGLLEFQAMWGLNFVRASDPRELMISEATAPNVRELVVQTEALSLDKAGDIHTLPITTDAATGPVVTWYLRAFRDQTVVEGLSDPPDTLAAVTLVMEDPPIGETFRGRGFPLHTRWRFPRPQQGAWARWGQDLAGWLLFTTGDQPTVEREVVLWVGSEP